VEVIGDVRFRMHPLTRADAEELVYEHPAARMLGTHRGSAAADVSALVDLLLRISELITVCPGICEVDLNPVKVLDAGQGVRVVDARIRMAPPAGAEWDAESNKEDQQQLDSSGLFPSPSVRSAREHR
jgi:acyl-CoA synthetase (NDP forming)